MSTQSLDVTVAGWVGSEVRRNEENGSAVPFSSFRVASTRRVRDRETGAWRDGRTEWFTVKTWGVTALNVAESLHKGDPVVVRGRLSTEEWSGVDGPRMSLVLVADAVGHDLSFGTTRFSRTVSRAERVGVGAAEWEPSGSAPASPSGEPAGVWPAGTGGARSADGPGTESADDMAGTALAESDATAHGRSATAAPDGARDATRIA